jgi:hypothetical protein
MLTFNKRYFVFTVILFFIEIAIALFVRDRFVRPYVGDVLVVILMYCFVKTFLRLPVLPVALSVLGFAFLIEALQLLRIVEVLGLQNSPVARTVIGTSFEWPDVLAYTIGCGIILMLEKRLPGGNTPKN